eukprot:UN21671
MDLLDASSGMFMMGLRPAPIIVDCGSDHTLQSLGASAHFKAERDVMSFNMGIIVGRDKL